MVSTATWALAFDLAPVAARGKMRCPDAILATAQAVVVGLLPSRSPTSGALIGELAVTETESRPRNRALVASFLFIDLVGYSKGTAADQYAEKAALSELLTKNLAALRKDDYRVKDTGDGALIAFLANPEHALYMALAIGEDFQRVAVGAGFPSNSLRTGLHIGAVKEALDLEARPNFVGDGINAAKRIMDFAAPGQITASRAYFEAVSWLDSSYAALFQHLGASDDKHGRAHELYAVSPSAAVLEKLRLDLAPTGREIAESDAKSVSLARRSRAFRADKARRDLGSAPEVRLRRSGGRHRCACLCARIDLPGNAFLRSGYVDGTSRGHRGNPIAVANRSCRRSFAGRACSGTGTSSFARPLAEA